MFIARGRGCYCKIMYFMLTDFSEAMMKTQGSRTQSFMWAVALLVLYWCAARCG